jgi:hypothetical protein
MFAVLEDAVSCFQNYLSTKEPARKKLFADAEAWLLDENLEWPFSFANICQEIGLDQDLVRAALMRWKHRMAAAQLAAQEMTKGKIASTHYQRGRRNATARRSKTKHEHPATAAVSYNL